MWNKRKITIEVLALIGTIFTVAFVRDITGMTISEGNLIMSTMLAVLLVVGVFSIYKLLAIFLVNRVFGSVD